MKESIESSVEIKFIIL